MKLDETTPHDETTADADLVLRTRSGDADAFGELWRRHYPSGISVARSVTSSIDPDDLVQESYTRIYQAIIKGGGPNGSFRAYLFTSIRNTAAAWGRSRRESAIDELDTVADPDSTEQAANEALDRSLTAQAFRSLPSRWQEVLWYTEIEQMRAQDVAPLLGMKAGAVSQLAFRAREGLREAWIQAHLRSAADGSDCQWTIEHLGAYSRGNLGTRDHKRLEEHLDECARCMIVAAEAKDVSTRLALVLLPLVLGVAGSAGYLATLQGGGTPIIALAAMPSGVVEGGVTIAGATAAGGASASGTGAGAGGGGAAGATAAGTSGALGGIGALVGVGSAALVVAGVVAAAAIVPGLTGAEVSMSLPSAGESNSATITTNIAPDASMNLDQPVVISQDDETLTPPPTTPAPDAAPPASSPPAGLTVPPSITPPEKPTEPEVPVDPELPVDPEVPPVVPEPTLPEGSPTWGPDTTVSFDFDTLKTHYRVPVNGEAGATVRALLDGAASHGDEITLLPAQTLMAAAEIDPEGAVPEQPVAGYGTIDLRPSLQQLCENATVTFVYVSGDLVGTPATTTLHELHRFRPPGFLCYFVSDAAPGEDPTNTQAPADDAVSAFSSPARAEHLTSIPAPAPTDPDPAAPDPAAPDPAAPAAPAPAAPAPAAPAPAAPAPAAPVPAEQPIAPSADAALPPAEGTANAE